MKYAALLSGGKDSCYNLMHCAHNGHQLVAAASLGPSQGKEEIDSYMYQTVGQEVIELVAQALDVPLYRRVISGTAINMGIDYGDRNIAENGGTDGDETEDLYELLLTVKAKHPEIEAISAGAILSTYQRVRVEHVCRRLSLTPLCYLWQRDQAELLGEMISAGLEAVLIKVAGMGLTTKHLGQTLCQMQSTLVRLNAMYDVHICGEGGEYETLTIDCPLFKKRIKLIETETVVHSDNGFATVAYLRTVRAVLEEKTEMRPVEPLTPPLLDADALGIQDEISSVALRSSFMASAPAPNKTLFYTSSSPPTKVISGWVAISEVQCQLRVGQVLSVEAEALECFRLLKDRLQQFNMDYTHCASINLFLSSIDLFGRVNVIYSTFFGSNPPARACVAVDLPAPHRMKLDCIAYRDEDPKDRHALHVQGLSYWAPANIGPYSQAIVVDDRVFVSGQIGLKPGNLSLPSPQSLATEAALASQHVSRIATALGRYTGDAWRDHVQLRLYWLQDRDHVPLVQQVLPKGPKTPVLYIVAAALPKGALIEEQVIMHTGRFFKEDEDGVIEAHHRIAAVDKKSIVGERFKIYVRHSHYENTRPFLVICVRGFPDQDAFDELGKHLEALMSSGILCGRLFYQNVTSLSPDPLPLFLRSFPTTTVPCRAVSTGMGEEWDYALCLFGC